MNDRIKRVIPEAKLRKADIELPAAYKAIKLAPPSDERKEEVLAKVAKDEYAFLRNFLSET
jgi:hypothetical protein